MNIGFIALETFFPTPEYIEWSRLVQVEEIISLDSALCPSIIKVSSDDDFLHQQEFNYNIFNNLDWVLSKVKDVENIQILAVLREPIEDCAIVKFNSRFRFCGYDLVEDDTIISALTNCGGFDQAFLPNDLSKYGLIDNFDKAKKVQLLLQENYPNEAHAYCTLWAIWKMDL